MDFDKRIIAQYQSGISVEQIFKNEPFHRHPKIMEILKDHWYKDIERMRPITEEKISLDKSRMFKDEDEIRSSLDPIYLPEELSAEELILFLDDELMADPLYTPNEESIRECDCNTLQNAFFCINTAICCNKTAISNVKQAS